MNARHLSLVLLFLLACAAMLLIPRAFTPRTGHLVLLTVATAGNESLGGTADLYLELRSGVGNVYIATFPFTKLDTQISTRFAKEIACSIVDDSCDRYDFFYTIRADSSIVGGPSAGAAIAALTASLLERRQVPAGVAMTGTINAGGLIGPVSGMQEKVDAAAQDGVQLVIVPALKDLEGNETLEVPANLTLVEVSTLQEALAAMHGEPLVVDNQTLRIPESYSSLMQAVAGQLCDRSEELRSQLGEDVWQELLFNDSEGFLADAALAGEEGWWYSKASYCFSANLRLRQLQLQLQNFTQVKLVSLAAEVNDSILERLQQLQEQELVTFSDLQTKAIVDERLREAQGYLQTGNVSAYSVAYALERYRSAVVWSSFFSLPGKPLQLDESHVRFACEQKLAEVEERVSYLAVLSGSLFETEGEELAEAYRMRAAGDYALCLFKASKAKAQLDVVLSGVGLSDEEYAVLLESRLLLARSVIGREIAEGRFPVMGYSYYEYAASLRGQDPYLAALFSSYALELSDLSIYFADRPSFARRVASALSEPLLFGFVAGVVVTVLLFLQTGPVQKKRARRKA